MINHANLLNKYQNEISKIKSLMVGIPAIIDDADDNADYFPDMSEQLMDEARQMQERLDALLMMLEKSVYIELIGSWYTEVETFAFFASFLDKKHLLVKKYSKPVFDGMNDFYQSTDAYKKWKKRVLHKYNYECFRCNNKSHLEVHHLYSKRAYPIYRMKYENGVVLCRPCHQEFHEVHMGNPRIPCTIHDFYNWIMPVT